MITHRFRIAGTALAIIGLLSGCAYQPSQPDSSLAANSAVYNGDYYGQLGYSDDGFDGFYDDDPFWDGWGVAGFGGWDGGYHHEGIYNHRHIGNGFHGGSHDSSFHGGGGHGGGGHGGGGGGGGHGR
jgi:hypothetical protein